MIRFLEYRHNDHSYLHPGLTDLFQDAVASGASLGYWHPLQDVKARGFWNDVVADVEAGRRILIVAVNESQSVLGAVQLSLSERQNGSHRAEVQKLMVHRRARGQGLGKALIAEMEAAAQRLGRTLLTLDTVKDSVAEGMYERLGYQRVGIIPRFTIEADGSQCDTVVFYKAL